MQDWGRELEQRLQAPPRPPRAHPGDHTWVLLTWGTPQHLSARGWPPLLSVHEHVALSIHFVGWFSCLQGLNPSACPLRSNPKCDTFASFLPCISLKVWTLSDQMIRTAKKLWQPAWNFFSTVISIYPGRKKKKKGKMLCSIPLNNWNSKKLCNIILYN